MSYIIHAHIIHSNQSPHFQIVEKTVFSDGTWSEGLGPNQTLTMGGSGTSGSLRLVANNGENFVITLGVHNFRRWGDIVTNLRTDQTAVVITPQYYSDDHPDRVATRWAQRVQYSVRNSTGRLFSYNFTVAEGNVLRVNITIG